MKVEACEHFINLLKEGSYFHAHEALEVFWFPRRKEKHEPEVMLLKGFINAAVSFELAKRGRMKRSFEVYQTYLKYKPLLYTFESTLTATYERICAVIEELCAQLWARYYHEQTKHSYESVRTDPNYLNWQLQPTPYKSYPKHLKRTTLDFTNENHRYLHLIAGITAKKTYPGVEYYLRTNPSAGALYPNELYVQAREVEGFEDGLYHYELISNALTLLLPLKDEGIEPAFGLKKQYKGFIFLLSTVYFRSSWKYRNRALRYCFLDSGHLLGSIEAASFVQERVYNIRYDFKKQELNEWFNFEESERFCASVLVGEPSTQPVQTLSQKLSYQHPCTTFIANKLIEQSFITTSSFFQKNTQTKQPQFNFLKKRFEEVILNRRSVRGFEKKGISKESFFEILHVLQEPINSDCDEEVNIYCILNRVVHMPLGLYHKQHFIKTGDFKALAGYLCLEQELGSHSAVTLFLTSKAQNYQAIYQKAGLIGHRLYLASLYHGIECSGIGAYYDDEVTAFLQNDEKVLYALAIGR